MEVPGMDKGKSESHITAAAAFVEEGIQEACDDSCSICLEAFSECDPCAVTSCKHEFHLQCILEWCQRSSNCPMCWQSISLKDPTSQELLEAVEQERSFRFNAARNCTIFHHPTFVDIELQHFPVGVNDTELEGRIIQHLAASAAMGRTHHVGRRNGSRSQSVNGRPQFLVFATNPNVTPAGTVSASPVPVRGESEPATITVASPSVPHGAGGVEGAQNLPTSGPVALNNQGPSVHNRSSSGQSSLPNQDKVGPSDIQSFSDSWKTRLNSLSMRCKESLSKSTRGLKEKLFSRSTSMADIGSEVKREVNAGIANVSRIMERLETRETNRCAPASESRNVEDTSAAAEGDNLVETHHETKLNDTSTAGFAAGSSLN